MRHGSQSDAATVRDWAEASIRQCPGEGASRLMGYAETLTVQDGRPLEDFELVAWDGSHISFEVISPLTNRLRSDWNQPNT